MQNVALVVALMALVGVLGVSSAESKGRLHRGPGDVPFVLTSGGCIDFDSDTPCPANDSDGDGWTDDTEAYFGSRPGDAASTPEFGLLDEQRGDTTCRDRVDNDGDGRRDMADDGCRLTCLDFTWVFDCIDWDRDGWKPYVENLYGSDPFKRSSTPETFWLPDTCTDGTDNDGDGIADEADSGCGIADCIDFDAEADCELV